MAGELAPDTLHLSSQESPTGADDFHRALLLWQETAVFINWDRFDVSLLQTRGQVLSRHFHIKVEAFSKHRLTLTRVTRSDVDLDFMADSWPGESLCHLLLGLISVK